MRLPSMQLAVRSLRRDAPYVATCVVTITLAIALNGGLYGLVREGIFAPEPFPSAARTYVIGPVTSTASEIEPLDTRAYEELRNRARLFSAVGGYAPVPISATVAERTHELAAAYVTPDLLPALGVVPARGRFPAASADQPEVVISAAHAAREDWRVGTVLTLRQQEVRVVGILAEGFQFPARQDAWLPLALRARMGAATDSSLSILAVARAGVTADAITHDVAAISGSVAGGAASLPRWRAVSYREYLVPAATRRLAVLLLATGLALAILATANIAGLTAAREVTRQRERSIQRALGASDLEIFWELVTSLGLITAPAVVIGGGVAHELLRVVRARYALSFPFWMTFTLDARGAISGVVLAFLMVVCSVALVMWRTRRGELAEQLRDAARGAQAGHVSSHQRRMVVFVQVAVAVAVVVVTGRLVQSAQAYVQQSPGFSSDGLLTARLEARMDTRTSVAGSMREPSVALETTRDRVRGLPGILTATVTSSVPAAGTADYAAVRTPGVAGDSGRRTVLVTGCDEYFFASLGVRPLAGRVLRAEDRMRGGRVNVVINQMFARQLLRTGDPLGALFPVFLGSDSLLATVVGITPDIADQIISMPIAPAIYVPLAALPDGVRYLVARAQPGDALGARLLATTILQEQHGMSLGRIALLNTLRGELYAQESMLGALATVLAVGAAILALIGVHALLRLMVEQERPDAAVRLALGAAPHRVGQRLLTQMLVLGALAVTTGVVLASMASGVLRSALFGATAEGVSAYVWTVVAALGLIGGEGILAWWRLSHSDPGLVLR